jgi:type I restriction enzyme S subunit
MYKDSGVPWIGQIPEHWTLQPNRIFMRQRKVLVGEQWHDYQLLSLTKEGIIIRDIESGKGKFSADMGTSQEVRSGDLVFCLFDVPETPRTIGLSRYDGMITGAYTVFECADPILAAYLEILYRALDDRKLLSPLYSGLRNTIPSNRLLSTKSPVPPPDEQRVIVRFLDYTDRHIRRYIRAKQRLIKLLNEQKQAIIHQAVTRGIDPSVRLNPSNIQWLGDIPEHWSVTYSKRIFTPRDELALPDDVQLSATQAYGVIPQDEFEQKVGRRVVKIFLHLDKRRHVERDDFVISMRSFEGGLERAWASGCIRSSYVVLKPATKIDVGYYSYLFKSFGYIQALQATANFIRDGQDLNYRNFCLVDLPLLPLDEQRAISSYLDGATESITKAIDRTKSEVELVQEYRTRLIADVVTGKLDVRGIALPAILDDTFTVEDEIDGLDDTDEMGDAEDIADADE